MKLLRVFGIASAAVSLLLMPLAVAAAEIPPLDTVVVPEGHSVLFVPAPDPARGFSVDPADDLSCALIVTVIDETCAFALATSDRCTGQRAAIIELAKSGVMLPESFLAVCPMAPVPKPPDVNV